MSLLSELAARMHTGVSRSRLTRELAGGANPGSSPELALRAAQLTGERNRERVVKTLRRAISEAYSPRLLRYTLVDRAAVRDAEDAINAMIARLSYARPVRVQGMAIVERMLTNADNSPLYGSDHPDDLRELLQAALAELDPAVETEHEFALAA